MVDAEYDTASSDADDGGCHRHDCLPSRPWYSHQPMPEHHWLEHHGSDPRLRNNRHSDGLGRYHPIVHPNRQGSPRSQIIVPYWGLKL